MINHRESTKKKRYLPVSDEEDDETSWNAYKQRQKKRAIYRQVQQTSNFVTRNGRAIIFLTSIVKNVEH